MFATTRALNGQMRFIHRYNAVGDLDKRAVSFLHDFAESYPSQLERNLYPDWYAACFMEDCSNSSVWGTYGQAHAGVCLRFRTTLQNERHLMSLNRVRGASLEGPIRGNVVDEVQKVVYAREHPSLDFFASLGRVPTMTLNRFWYSSPDGDRSSSANRMRYDEDEWRKAYWQSFAEFTTRKLEDWSFEREYRLVLTSSVVDLTKPETRKATYRFEDLDGIVFGIRTPIEAKLAIARIVEEKCRATGRKDFKFFQAYYSRTKGAIERHELDLIKFSSLSGGGMDVSTNTPDCPPALR